LFFNAYEKWGAFAGGFLVFGGGLIKKKEEEDTKKKKNKTNTKTPFVGLKKQVKREKHGDKPT